MKVIISILILIIILYYSIKWLYNELKNEFSDINSHSIHMQRKLSELERKCEVNEQLINWLCNQVANYKLKEKKKKEGKK